MAYADAKARLLTHARTAGAALSPAIEDVSMAFPLPRGECVRVWYGGEADPEKMGESRYTMNSELVGQITWIGAFWPLTALDEETAALVDARAQAFTHALRTAVDGDSALNGTADNTTLGDAEPDFTTIGNTRYIVMTWRAVTSYTEYTIAP